MSVRRVWIRESDFEDHEARPRRNSDRLGLWLPIEADGSVVICGDRLRMEKRDVQVMIRGEWYPASGRVAPMAVEALLKAAKGEG